MHKSTIPFGSAMTYKTWLQPSDKGNTFFSCKICVKDYIDGISAVNKHNNSKKHQQKIKAISLQPKLPSKLFSISPDKILKHNEIKIAALNTI